MDQVAGVGELLDFGRIHGWHGTGSDVNGAGVQQRRCERGGITTAQARLDEAPELRGNVDGEPGA